MTMGLRGFFSRVFLGVDLDSEEARARDLDAQSAVLNRDRFDRGYWSEEVFAQAEAGRIENAAEIENYNRDIGDAFVTGAAEGLAQTADAINDGMNSVAGGILSWTWRAVPWWVWIGGGIALLAYTGLLGPLAGLAVSGVRKWAK